MVKLDQIDLTLLLLLSKNSRASLTNLGKDLNLTPAAITYRINKLVENKIIEKFTISINNTFLTPTYQKFLLQGHIKPEKKDVTIALLQDLNLFDQFYLIAAHDNFIGITSPLSHKALKFLLEHISNLESYTIIPILDQENGVKQMEIIAEDIASIYCPYCQTHILAGDVIIGQIGNQIMGFCCRDCKIKFENDYDLVVTETE